MPRIVTGILWVLDQNRMLVKNLTVIGTNAIYATAFDLSFALDPLSFIYS
jgi:hypothetical protein